MEVISGVNVGDVGIGVIVVIVGSEEPFGWARSPNIQKTLRTPRRREKLEDDDVDGNSPQALGQDR